MSTTDGFYFECEPVDAQDGSTKVKEVIELRYPGLKMKIDEKYTNNYLTLIFFIIFLLSLATGYTTYYKNNYEIITILSGLLGFASFVLIILVQVGIFS